MAASDSVVITSLPAGATFSSSDLYKGVVLNANGDVVLPNTTGDITAIGVLYGVTHTTANSTGFAAVPVAIDGRMKLRMAASTIAAGGIVGISTAGLGIAPSTDVYRFGLVVKGSSGAVNRVVEVIRSEGPLNA